MYTTKRVIEHRAKKQQKTRGRDLTRSNVLTILSQLFQFRKLKFVFQEKKNKTHDHALILISTKDRQTAIWAKTNEIIDEYILYAIEGHGSSHTDKVASEVRDHRNCMASYLLK